MSDQPTPRRIRLDRCTSAELAIYHAMEAVEALPPDVRLTKAVTLLRDARERVADFVDGVDAPALPPDPDTATHRPFSELRAELSPDSQQRAADRAAELLVADPDAARRLRELARDGAKFIHNVALKDVCPDEGSLWCAGHRLPFDTCPHPDCTLVRSTPPPPQERTFKACSGPYNLDCIDYADDVANLRLYQWCPHCLKEFGDACRDGRIAITARAATPPPPSVITPAPPTPSGP